MRLIGIVFLSMIAAACASGPKLYVNENPAASFANYRTYGFSESLGTDRAEYNSMLSQYLTDAVGRELNARGYEQSDEPDLRVNFFVNTKEKIRATQTPTAGGYYGYRRGSYVGWDGYETRVSQFTEGTLTIDMVDAEVNQLVWEANAVGRVTEKDRENLKAAVDEAVTAIFSKFSYRAPR